MHKLLVSLIAAATVSQPAVLAPGENLVVEGVPSPPLSLVQEIERYTEFRSASFEDWHPERREMLMGTRFADSSQIHFLKAPGGARTQLTFYNDTANGAQFQPIHGKTFIFSKDKGGNEFFQKYQYDMESKQTSLISDGKARNTGGVWSCDGTRYIYSSTRRNGADVDLYIYDQNGSPNERMLAQLSGGGWEALDWSPDDKTLLATEYISANESYLWLIDTTSGAKTALTPRDNKVKVAYSGGQFSKDGRGVYVATDKDSEFQRLAYIDLSSHSYRFITSDIPWDVEQFDLSWDGKKIAAVMNEDGLSKLHLFAAETGSELPLPKLPEGQVSRVAWHKNNKDLAFDIDNARSPGDIYSLDTSTGIVERWTESETGDINTDAFSEPRLVHWKSFDGLALSAFLFMPPKTFTGKRPVIVNIHGGPESQWRPYFLGRYNYLIHELGVAFICPNVRGSTGYGKSFSLMDNGFNRENSYKDIGALLDWIKQQPELDGDRIMITGGSYGGNMTLATSMLYADKIRCSLDIVGPSNLVTSLEHTQAYRRDLRRAEYGDERDPKMREYLLSIAPATHPDKIKKPLFVVQGKNDPRVPASESEQMVAAIRKTGTPVWFLMANDEGHGFGKKKNRDYLFYTTVEFIQKYLLDH